MATARDRKNEYKEAYDQAHAAFGAWQMQAKHDLRVYLGDPWTSADRIRFNKEKRVVMENRIAFPPAQVSGAAVVGDQKFKQVGM